MKKFAILLSAMFIVVLIVCGYIRPKLSPKHLQTKADKIAMEKCSDSELAQKRTIDCKKLELFNTDFHKEDIIARNPEYTTFHYSVGIFPNIFNVGVSLDKFGGVVAPFNL